jgi:hypothetical protein
MEQRANAWVQRLYDLCCDAYKSHGKTLSADFDRALWAYRVEPFIMGETDSQIHDQTMAGFLNLLLCAVGSPPEKRALLKVSQKRCCFDVRRKIYETWYDKLHHLPPRINESIAALFRQNELNSNRAALRLAAVESVIGAATPSSGGTEAARAAKRSSLLSNRDLQIHDVVGGERFRTLTNAEIMKEASVKKRLRRDFGLEPGDAAKLCLDRVRHAKGYPLSREIAKKRSARK